VDFVGIESVHYGTEDMKLARRLFTDWGVAKVSDSRGLLRFATGNGTRIEVREGASSKLAPRINPQSQFREFVLGAKSRRDIEQLATELSRDRQVRQDPDGSIHSVDDCGIHFGVALSTCAKAAAPQALPRNAPGERKRIDVVSPMYAGARPWQIGHIVFFVPDVRAAEAFYRQRLGFWLSDRYVGGAGSFLRWARRSEHHNMFLLKSPTGQPALHHLAFEVRDQHEVFGGGLEFARRGWETEVGPGRHPISSAYFWYFKNPLGGSIEYFCDPDYVTEKWKPRQFRVNRFSEWHLPKGIGEKPEGRMAPSLATAKAIEAMLATEQVPQP
jgi:catechol 2,3-dioxygenase-like lactoylglutathione lyase family enzyme